MAGEDGVYIRLGADSTELQAAFSKAEASLKSLSDRVQGATAGLAPMTDATRRVVEQYDRATVSLRKGGEAFQAVTEALQANEISASQAIRTLSGIEGAAMSAAQGHEHLSFATAGTTREFIVLGHEAVSGNFSRIPGSLMVLAERMGSLSPATLAAVTAVGSLGAALYELVAKANEAAEAINRVQGAASSIGNANSGHGAAEAIRAQVVELEHVLGVSEATASSIIAAMNRIPEASENTRRSLARVVGAFAIWDQMEPEKEAERFASAFGNVSGLEKMAHDLNLLTDQQRRVFGEAKEGNNIYAAQDLILAGLERRVAGTYQQVKRYNEQGSVSRLVSGPVEKPLGNDAPHQSIQDQQNERDAGQLTKVTEDVVAQYRQQAEAEGRTKAQIDADVVAMWQNVLAITQQYGTGVSAASKALAAAEVAARKSSAERIIAVEEGRLAKQLEGGKLGAAQELEAKVASDRRILSSANLTADERLTRETKLSGDLKALHEQEAADAEKAAKQKAEAGLRAIQEEVAAAKPGSEQRIAVLQREVDYAQRVFGQETSQYKSALDQMAQAARAWQANQDAILKSRTSAEQQVAQYQLQAEKDRLDAEVASGEMSAGKRVATIKSLTETSYREDLKRLQNELSTLDQSDKAYADIYGKIEVLKARHTAEMARLDTQEATARQAAIHAWTSPVGSAVNTMISGYMQGTQTLGQIAAKGAQAIAISYAQKGAEMLGDWAEKHVLMAAWDRLTATQSVAVSAAAETGKTAVATTGAAARNTIGNAEQAGFLTRVARQVAEWLGFESEKTAETDAAAGERISVLTAETTAATTAAKAQATEMIPAYTGIAAMAAASAVAAIPFTGPEEAAAAAIAMDKLGAAQMTIASAAGGWDRVPYDGAMAELHKDEMVLPAAIAHPLRSLVSNGFTLPDNLRGSDPTLSTAAAASTSETHHHYSPSVSVSVGGQGGAMSHDQVADAVARALRSGHGDLIRQLRRTV